MRSTRQARRFGTDIHRTIRLNRVAALRASCASAGQAVPRGSKHGRLLFIRGYCLARFSKASDVNRIISLRNEAAWGAFRRETIGSLAHSDETGTPRYFSSIASAQK